MHAEEISVEDRGEQELLNEDLDRDGRPFGGIVEVAAQEKEPFIRPTSTSVVQKRETEQQQIGSYHLYPGMEANPPTRSILNVRTPSYGSPPISCATKSPAKYVVNEVASVVANGLRRCVRLNQLKKSLTGPRRWYQRGLGTSIKEGSLECGTSVTT